MGIVKAAQMAGLFYVLRNVVQVGTSYPIGVLADRFGSMPVLIPGYALETLTAILTPFAFLFGFGSVVFPAGIFCLAGLYMAVQEALKASVTADLVQPNQLGMSYGALGTVNGSAKFVSSTMVGVLWSVFSPVVGFGLASLLLAVGTLLLLRQRRG